MQFHSITPILYDVTENHQYGSTTGEAGMAIQTISSVSSTNGLASTLAVSNQTSTGKSGGGVPAGKAGGGVPKAKPASTSSSTSSTSSDTKIYDKMDVNKDGTVSAQEKAAYLVVHPEEAAQEAQSTNYNGNGKNSEDLGSFSTIINLSA
jgi:hypothetical protein